MQISNAYLDHISTYPGSYTPIQFQLETLTSELSKSHHGTRNPPCNICETSQYYKIELAVPGLKREDFFAGITTKGHLSVSALHQDTDEVRGEYRKQTFNYSCFKREMNLPDNVDTDFTRAEYRDGILAFWFLKTDKPYRKSASVIVIY